MALLIAVISDGIGRNDSTACILHEIASISAKLPTIAGATTAWIDSTTTVSSHFSQSILDNASVSALLFPDL